MTTKADQREKMKIQQDKLLDILLRAKDLKGFLAAADKQLRKDNPKFSYTVFARRAGFSSRSYARMCMVGQREISPQTLPKLIRALGLKGDSSKYFTQLAEASRANFEFDAKKDKKFVQLKRKIVERSSAVIDHRTNNTPYEINEWPIVYAALGDTVIGATLAEILERTGLNEHLCKRILSRLVETDAATYDAINRTYTAKSAHVLFDRLGGDNAFRNYFVWSLKNLQAAAHDYFECDDHLFMTSTFSVKRSRLPAIKQIIEKLLHDAVVESEQCDGDSIVTLTMGLVPQSGVLSK